MRARRPKVKRDRDLTNGPGKLCMAMGIVGDMSGESLRTGRVVIRAGTPVSDADVVVTPRIGITQAAEWPLRYLVRDDPFVSPTPAAFPRTTFAR
jgi:DNA-3-methyladenine glycosylase